MLDVYEIARKYIAKAAPAVSGQGGHDQTFSVACTLVKGFAFSIGEARPLLEEYNQRCQPPWTAAELEHKLQSAEVTKDVDALGYPKTRGWLLPEEKFTKRPVRRSTPAKVEPKPKFNEDKLKQFAMRWRPFVNTAWLADRSIVNPYRLGAQEFLRALYRPSEMVVIFTNARSQGQALWPAQKIPESGPNGVWFLAQPVDGKFHLNPRHLDNDGQPVESRRSEESVVAWRFLVLESDLANPYDWTAVLIQLPLAVAAIYTSGRRSIHALVRADARSIEEWRKFSASIKRGLVTLGVDRQVAASAVRLSRLPGCYRGKRLQKLLFLNPEPEAKPIIALPRLRDVLAGAAARLSAPGLLAADVIENAKAKNLNDCIEALDAHERLKATDSQPAIELLRWFESSPVARAALELSQPF